MAYEGGYVLQAEDMLRQHIHSHTASLDQPFSQLTVDAVNAIQETPWVINRTILETIREFYLADDCVGEIPTSSIPPRPARIPDDVWAGMTEEAKAATKAQLSERYATIARLEGASMSFLAKLGYATELKDEPSIWFAHFLDFRGRAYPIAADLHPQGDDISKSLLMFAEGKPLGENGRKWLAIRLANNYGLDKLPLDARWSWVETNSALIIASANDPVGTRWWTKAEEPWQFLAGCIEWREMFTAPSSAEFVSHLPVNVDGSANGLQHLSAMGRDTVGAAATNMRSIPDRQDIYQAVADVISQRVATDAAAGNESAIYWAGRITRSVVKRAVMTTPYGVTDRGIRDQLVADGHVTGVANKGVKLGHANYLRDQIVVGLGTVVESAKSIMAYIQAVAQALCDAGLPLRWQTPSGNTIQQSYYNLTRREVVTVAGRYILWGEEPTAGLDVRKNILASAPNVIHSLDASALMMTVHRATVEAGEPLSWCMIHDSYGTHAADMDRLSRVLREVFVDMYRGDWLEEFEAYIKEYAPGVDLPRRPARGDFDLSEVLQSQYFFS